MLGRSFGSARDLYGLPKTPALLSIGAGSVRLRAAGKAAKSALTAVARKLLTIANAMIRDMEP